MKEVVDASVKLADVEAGKEEAEHKDFNAVPLNKDMDN